MGSVMLSPPRLLEICLQFLTQHLDEVESFEGIDSALKAELLARVLRDKDRDSSLASVLKLLDENTTSIDLSEYLFNKEMAFDKLFSKMTSLHTLSICGHPNLNDIVMENIIRWCPTLKTINLYKNPRITDKSLALVRASCPNLERLHMRYCIGISGIGFCLWELDQVHSKAEKHKSPKKGIIMPPTPQIPYFMHLTELDIGECKSIIPAKIIPLSKLFPVLQTLAIGKLFLGDEDAEAIIKSAPPSLSSLVNISYNPISYKAISALCSPAKRTQFVSLNFKSCRCILNNAESPSFIDVIRDIPNLTSLDTSLCYQIGEYDFFSEQDDKFEFAKCLRTLDLSNCGNVTGKTLEHLSKFGFKHSLKELRLYGCDKTYDAILSSLLMWFPNLELVDLGGCKSVQTESEVAAFRLAHPKLKFRTPVVNYMPQKQK